MRAIPTAYRGHTFRSRLEADYAATLDSLEVAWNYEPEGYELSDGTWYLPDFYLPELRAWLEVKGEHDERLDKPKRFALDLLAESPADHYADDRAPLVLLGRKPNPVDSWCANETLTWLALPGASVMPAECPSCRRFTLAVIGAAACRRCGWVTEEPLGWHEFARWGTPFVRAPRPHEVRA